MTVAPPAARFAGQTLSSDTLVLVTVTLPSADDGATVAAGGDSGAATIGLQVNCEKIVVSNMLLKDLKTQLA